MSTEDWQDPVTSRVRQREQAGALVRGHGQVVAEFFDAGQSRTVAWGRRPEAAQLAGPGRGWDAIVIGEYERAFTAASMRRWRRCSSPAGVLARHMPTAGAAIAADRDQQRRRAPPQRLVRQPPGHAVARRSLASAAATPPGELVALDDPAGQHRTTGLEPLTHDLRAEFVKAAERAQVGGRKVA